MNTYQIVFLCIAAAILAVYFVDRLTGRKLTLAVIQWRPTLIALTALCDAISKVLPSSAFTVVATVLKAASDATQKAEELYIIGELPKAERNQYAQKLIAETLCSVGIDVTEQIQQIIDGCIAVVCMLMPHGVTPTSDVEK